MKEVSIHQTILRININNRCHEKWQEMTPVEQGVYCKSCCKEVSDFSSMSEHEIFNYLEQRKGEQLCGRFRKEQLSNPIVYISPKVFSMDIPLWKKFLAALFICFSSFMVGCGTKGLSTEKYIVPIPQNTAIGLVTNQSEYKEDKTCLTNGDSIDISTMVFGNFFTTYEETSLPSFPKEPFFTPVCLPK